MSRHYSEDPEYSEISKADKLMRDRIIALLSTYSRDMTQAYGCGRQTGIPEDDYDEAADDILMQIVSPLQRHVSTLTDEISVLGWTINPEQR